MNKDHINYKEYLTISENWQLDDWSITKECFDKIVELLPFGKTILEIGSGNSTEILSQFYNMISIESNTEWLNKFKSNYYYVPLKKMNSMVFGETTWLDVDILSTFINKIDYDLLIVDAGGDRVGIFDYISLFKMNIPIIFDDTMDEGYLQCAILVADKLNKLSSTITCKVNKYVVHWFNGKKFTIIFS
jgi:hypothetical protein